MNLYTFSVTDLRQRTKSVLADVAKNGYSVLIRNSKPEAALVDVDYLKILQEAYEDYMDILEYDKTIDEPTISWKEYKSKTA